MIFLYTTILINRGYNMNNTSKLCYFRIEKRDKDYNNIIRENLFEKDFIFYNKYKIDYNNNCLNIELPVENV